jgi:hypothetical protein
MHHCDIDVQWEHRWTQRRIDHSTVLQVLDGATNHFNPEHVCWLVGEINIVKKPGRTIFKKSIATFCGTHLDIGFPNAQAAVTETLPGKWSLIPYKV